MPDPMQPPPENERVIRLAYQALNAGDLEAGKQVVAADVELVTGFTSLAGRPYLGHDGLAQWAADVDESWEDMTQTLERLIPVDPERTVVVVRVQARGRGSGVNIDQTVPSIITVRAGKVTRVEGYSTLEDALSAAGIEP